MMLSSVSLISRSARGFQLLRSASARCTLLWVLRPPPEPVVYPPLPPLAVEDPWAWYCNAKGDEDDDDNNEIEEDSE
jgi:hypothetical protein